MKINTQLLWTLHILIQQSNHNYCIVYYNIHALTLLGKEGLMPLLISSCIIESFLLYAASCNAV